MQYSKEKKIQEQVKFYPTQRKLIGLFWVYCIGGSAGIGGGGGLLGVACIDNMNFLFSSAKTTENCISYEFVSQVHKIMTQTKDEHI